MLTLDIETTLQQGESWGLDVKDGARLVYRTSITSEER